MRKAILCGRGNMIHMQFFFDAVRESLTFNKLVDDGIEVQQVMVLEEET